MSSDVDSDQDFKAALPSCPICKRNENVNLNGVDRKTADQPQKYCCTKCKRCFRFPYRREVREFDTDIYELTKAFVYGKADLDYLAEQVHLPKSTLYARMRKFISTLPSVNEEIKRLDKARTCVVMGIDTSPFKIGSEPKPKPYLLVMDNLKGNLIYKKLLEREDGATITLHLKYIRDELHCNPRLITCDLGPSILHAIKEVFPSAIIEGCWFHEYRRLEDKMPTSNEIDSVNDDTRAFWREVKRQILKCLIAVDADRRKLLLKRLGQLRFKNDSCKRAEKAVANFRDHCESGYYHTQDFLYSMFRISNLDRLVYNNMPESRFKQAKGRSKKTRLWPTVYENVFYLFKMQDAHDVADSPQILTGQEPQYHLPVSFFLDSLIDSNEFTDIGLSKEITERSAISSGAVIINDRIVGDRFLDRMEQYIQRTMKKRSITLSDLYRQFSLPEHLAHELVQLTSFKVEAAEPGYITLKAPASSDVRSPKSQPDTNSNVTHNTTFVDSQGSHSTDLSQTLSEYKFPAWIDAKKLTNATAIASVLYDINRPLTSRQITDILKREWKERLELRNVSRELTTPGYRLASHLVKTIRPRTYNLSQDGRIWFQTDASQELS